MGKAGGGKVDVRRTRDEVATLKCWLDLDWGVPRLPGTRLPLAEARVALGRALQQAQAQAKESEGG